MALTPDDAQRERYEKQRRLGALRTRAAREGAEASPQLLTEIEDLERELSAVGVLNLDYETMQHLQAPAVSRYEFNELTQQVRRITLVLVIATSALVLSLISFILTLIVLVSK